jgi:probable DNA metabolism protein
MNTIVYDGSFSGLLTAVFEVYEYKMTDVSIRKQQAANSSLFGNAHRVYTNNIKAERVLKKLEQKLSGNACQQFYKTFLSELPSIENTLLRYVQYNVAAKKAVENDYSNPDVLMVQQTSRKVDREKHRMKAFIRFQLTKDALYYAVVQPDFDVLPLVSRHFKERYADQRWMIYDSTRKYGIFYDLRTVETVEVQFNETAGKKDQMIYDENEALYQALWQQYFSSVNIKARRNMKLHIQHMPKRYWKYLVEKHVSLDDHE